MAIGNFQFTEGRCTVGVCIAVDYGPHYLFSKYPASVAPLWNLVMLFPPLIWAMVLVSIILVLAVFQLSSIIYSNLGFKESIINCELVLIPTRYNYVIHACKQQALVDFCLSEMD